MSRITERSAVGAVEVFNNSTDPSLVTLVGSKYDFDGGREGVLVQVGGTAIAAGNLVQSPAFVANHGGLVTTAFTAYSANGNQPAQVTVTLGATAVLANEYYQGYAYVVSGTGVGQILKIASNPAASASASVVITLEDSPLVALDTTSVITLIKNAYGSSNGTNVGTNGVVINPTALTGEIIGATFYALNASTTTLASFGLIQTVGNIVLNSTAIVAAGVEFAASAATAGSIAGYTAGTNSKLGIAWVAAAASKANLCYLTL